MDVAVGNAFQCQAERLDGSIEIIQIANPIISFAGLVSQIIQHNIPVGVVFRCVFHSYFCNLHGLVEVIDRTRSLKSTPKPISEIV
jgi:hypothetical protein